MHTWLARYEAYGLDGLVDAESSVLANDPTFSECGSRLGGWPPQSKSPSAKVAKAS